MIKNFLFVFMMMVCGAANAEASTVSPIPEGFDIYRETISSPQHVDWLWRDYLKNGNVSAIEKIVSAFHLSQYAGNLDKAKEIKKTRELTSDEKQGAYLELVFRSAMWSLESNARQHPEVLAELKRIEHKKRNEKDPSCFWLLSILSRVAPGEYRENDGSGGVSFTTPDGIVRLTKAK